ncbi:hypothetical protein D3C85_225350 [compost metagenome]|jgi:hypothetical protein
MGRYADTLTNKAYAERAQMTVLNMAVQGQQGYLTDMQYYPSATDYIRKPLIIKVLQAPAGLMMLPNGQLYVAAYKNFIENWMQSWNGFNRTLTVNTQETQLGNAGEVFQTPSRVSRARSQITSTVVDKDRRPIMRFMEDMVRYLFMDPDTGHPLLTGVSDRFTDQLADVYGGTIIAFEPDKTFRYVENSWLITNFWLHQEIGENIGNRQLQQDGELATYNLSWTGWQKVGYAVDKLAQGFMDAVRVSGMDPQYQANFVTGVDSNVSAVATGFTEQINAIKGSLVTP